MRLIDAEELLKEFDPDGEMISPIAARMKIVLQSTAYDVDKVVEQLQRYPYSDQIGWLALSEVKTIVKAGGVNET